MSNDNLTSSGNQPGTSGTVPQDRGRKLQLVYSRSDAAESLARRARKDHRVGSERLQTIQRRQVEELLTLEARDYQRIVKLRRSAAKLSILAAVVLLTTGFLLFAVFSGESPDRHLLVAVLSIVVGLSIALTTELIKTSVPTLLDSQRQASLMSSVVHHLFAHANGRSRQA